MQRPFSKVIKEVIVELRPSPDEHHLLIGLKDEETFKKTPEKKNKKKVIEEVPISEREYSSEFDDICYTNYSAPSKEVHKKPKGNSTHVIRISTILMTMMKRLERV